MSLFDDDPFDEIVREFFGGNRATRKQPGRQKFAQGEEEERGIDFIQEEKNVYLVFELPGFDYEDLSVTVKGRDLEITAKKKDSEQVQGYLKDKLVKGIKIKKEIPDFIKFKGFNFTMKNGVLEIKLELK